MNTISENIVIELEISKIDIELTAEQQSLFRGEQGTEGQAGKNGADGQDGYTPQKGVDYFTEEEISEIKQKIKSEIEIPGKTSDLINDGFDGSSPYTTEEYVDNNAGGGNEYFADNATLELYTDTADNNKLKFRVKQPLINIINAKQNATDNMLLTNNKTISGAINEIYSQLVSTIDSANLQLEEILGV